MEKFFGMDAQKYQQLSALITEVFSVLSDNKNKTPEELARDIFVFISVRCIIVGSVTYLSTAHAATTI